MNQDPFATIPNADDADNGEFSPAAAPAPEPKVEAAPRPAIPDAQVRWMALRTIVEHDITTYRSILNRNEFPNLVMRLQAQIDAFSAVLDSMDTLEHGAEYTLAKIEAEEKVAKDALAAHTQAACDTITKAAR